jgi:uncharacterized protein (DUF362 family)
VIGAVVHLMDRAGAQRVRLLESGYASAIPLDEYMYQAGWDVGEIVRAGGRVELENTNWLGRGSAYHRFDVPGGGLLFPSYHLNRSFRDCDVFVSLTKLKDHTTAGVTLSMKNCFGNIPTTIYGDHTAKAAPTSGRSGRNFVFHDGSRQPASPAAPEIDPASPRHEGYRIPRVVVDICAARPIDLAILDGIDTMGGTEGPWSGGEACHAGVLLVGTNCVNTDTVATAVMGYDPMARAGEAPFVWSDNILELAERKGLGSRDLGRIEVAGTPIREARYDFAPLPQPLPRTCRLSRGKAQAKHQAAQERLLQPRRRRRPGPLAPPRGPRPSSGPWPRERTRRACAWARARTPTRRRCAASGRSAWTAC